MHGKPDVVVVGSGHNGLVSAAYLAAAGTCVHVLERQPWLGGVIVTKELPLRRAGERIDMTAPRRISVSQAEATPANRRNHRA